MTEPKARKYAPEILEAEIARPKKRGGRPKKYATDEERKFKVREREMERKGDQREEQIERELAKVLRRLDEIVLIANLDDNEGICDFEESIRELSSDEKDYAFGRAEVQFYRTSIDVVLSKQYDYLEAHAGANEQYPEQTGDVPKGEKLWYFARKANRAREHTAQYRGENARRTCIGTKSRYQ